MRWQLRDPEVRRKVWPDYTFGCKRVLFSSYFLPALQRARRRARDRADHGRHPGRGPDRRRRRARGRLHHLGHRLPHQRLHVPDGDQRRRRPQPQRRVGGRRARSPRDHRPRVPVAVSHVRAEHEHLGRLDRLLPRGPGRLHPPGARSASATPAPPRSRSGPTSRPASDRETQARFAGTAWIECDSWYRDETGRIVANWPGYMREYAELTEPARPGRVRADRLPRPG